MSAASQSLHTHFQSLHTYLENMWTSFSPQEKKITWVATALFTAFIWISLIYKLHKYIQSKNPTIEELKIERIVRPILKKQEIVIKTANEITDWTGSDGKVFKGNFKIINGQPNGKGIATNPNGSLEEGSFEQGILHGEGSFTYSDFHCRGQFQRGHLTYGKLSFINSDNYIEGPVVNLDKIEKLSYSNFTGKCKAFWSKSFLEGHFIEGKLEGEGKKIKNGITYEGTFENDLLIYGKKTYPNGKEEVGKFSSEMLII